MEHGGYFICGKSSVCVARTYRLISLRRKNKNAAVRVYLPKVQCGERNSGPIEFGYARLHALWIEKVDKATQCNGSTEYCRRES